jgi:hypothetical protein
MHEPWRQHAWCSQDLIFVSEEIAARVSEFIQRFQIWRMRETALEHDCANTWTSGDCVSQHPYECSFIFVCQTPGYGNDRLSPQVQACRSRVCDVRPAAR